jgi:SRSO17 transposase
VFAACASWHGYALVDKRLFMPEPWFTDAYARRRTTCKVPDDCGFQTKPQLAAAMLREIREEGVLPFKYVVADWSYISNAPVSTRLPLFVWLSGLRWAIEQCFEEAKTELDLDQYEVRKYPGWHHHMLTTMLAHFFLWHLQIRLGKKAPALTLSQLRSLLGRVCKPTPLRP